MIRPKLKFEERSFFYLNASLAFVQGEESRRNVMLYIPSQDRNALVDKEKLEKEKLTKLKKEK